MILPNSILIKSVERLDNPKAIGVFIGLVISTNKSTKNIKIDVKEDK
ncbi:hypothetical protein [Paraclostridium sordellii]|nr:hypothetical protein [Paeniclostridium sordellii]